MCVCVCVCARVHLVGVFEEVRNCNSITGRMKHVFFFSSFFLGGGGYMCRRKYRMDVLDKEK